MAGHSKWANIQHRKGKQDAKRGKVFTKLIRAITVASRLGGPDPESNPRLRDAVLKAKTVNMPNDNIDRAIKKGAGALEGNHLEEITYEGYGPGGVAILVECLTDNRNRTVGDVRHAFTKCGGNLGTTGSVGYLFSKQGQMSFSPDTDENMLIEGALEIGAEDITTNDDGSIDVTVEPEKFDPLKEALISKGLMPEYAEISMVAAIQVPLDEDSAEKILRLQDILEDLDDVQNVYSNAEISTAVLEKISNK